MTYQEYINIFKNNDSYESPAHNNTSIINGFLNKNRFLFYYKFVKVILNGAKVAKSGLYDTNAWIENSLNNLIFIENCGGQFRISGLNNLRIERDKGVVIVANHMSTLETVVLPSIIRSNRDITFVVKDSLVKDNTFGAIMRATNPIVVGRKSPREDLEHVLKTGEKILKSGKSLIIFPQSTRTSVFDPKTFNTLGIKLAKRANVKIIPLALKTDLWGNGKLIREIGKISLEKKIHFTFDKPIEIKGNGKEEHKYIIEFISKMQEKWQKIQS